MISITIIKIDKQSSLFLDHKKMKNNPIVWNNAKNIIFFIIIDLVCCELVVEITLLSLSSLLMPLLLGANYDKSA